MTHSMFHRQLNRFTLAGTLPVPVMAAACTFNSVHSVWLELEAVQRSRCAANTGLHCPWLHGLHAMMGMADALSSATHPTQPTQADCENFL